MSVLFVQDYTYISIIERHKYIIYIIHKELTMTVYIYTYILTISGQILYYTYTYLKFTVRRSYCSHFYLLYNFIRVSSVNDFESSPEVIRVYNITVCSSSSSSRHIFFVIKLFSFYKKNPQQFLCIICILTRQMTIRIAPK